MRRFETVLEVRKCLHELSRTLARRGNLVPHAQIAHSARKQTLHRTHRLQREIGYRMPCAIRCVTYLLTRKCAQVYVLHDKLNPFHLRIKRVAACREESYPLPCLVLREQEEPCEERERDEEYDKVGHGTSAWRDARIGLSPRARRTSAWLR